MAMIEKSSLPIRNSIQEWQGSAKIYLWEFEVGGRILSVLEILLLTSTKQTKQILPSTSQQEILSVP